MNIDSILENDRLEIANDLISYRGWTREDVEIALHCADPDLMDAVLESVGSDHGDFELMRAYLQEQLCNYFRATQGL